MSELGKDIIISVIMGVILPGVLLNCAVAVLEDDMNLSVMAVGETADVFELSAQDDIPMRLRYADGTVEERNLEEYLVGVVLAEMPAAFEEEALKAQAIVARTYTRKAYLTGGKHGDGSTCTSSSCCQAYISESAYLDSGGTLENIEKIRKCIESTSGMLLTYAGDLIEATYFSCSGGSTEDAVAVWGTDFPYLRTVSSPGEENATYYTDTVRYTKEQLETKTGISLTGNSAGWFSNISYTSGGGVEWITIGEQNFTGTEMRSLLNLRSTAFTIIPEENAVTILTRGYGHRVGMSQYGADAMAANGSDFRDILAHYYPGTEIETIS